MRVGISTKKRKYKLQTVFSLGVLARLLRRAKWIDGSETAKPRCNKLRLMRDRIEEGDPASKFIFECRNGFSMLNNFKTLKFYKNNHLESLVYMDYNHLKQKVNMVIWAIIIVFIYDTSKIKIHSTTSFDLFIFVAKILI
jgi:hypothetical protein